MNWLESYAKCPKPARPVPLSENEKEFLTERAAIAEIDGGLSRDDAERLAWDCLRRLRAIGEAP